MNHKHGKHNLFLQTICKPRIQ